MTAKKTTRPKKLPANRPSTRSRGGGTAKYTPLEARFVKLYPIRLNGAAAAIEAGYAEGAAKQMANKLLKKQHIMQGINAEIERIMKRLEIKQDDVVLGLFREASYYGEGASHGARVSAWEKLGKHLGMFVERKMVGFRPLNEMNEDELAYFLGETANAPE